MKTSAKSKWVAGLGLFFLGSILILVLGLSDRLPGAGPVSTRTHLPTPFEPTARFSPTITSPPTPSPIPCHVCYVATNGSDSNPGTVELPWRTVQKAADTLVAGDTVYIRGGIYESTERIEPRNSGTASAYITYKAYPGEQPEIITNDAQGFFIAGTGTSKIGYIEINGLTVTAKDAPFTTESCGTGIYIQDGHHIRVLNNIVRGSGGSGITFETGSDYALVEGNVVYGNSWGCSSWRGSAINFHRIMWYDQAEGYHNIVRRNLVYHNYHDPAYVREHTDGNAIAVDEGNDVNASGTNPPVLIENNIAFDNAGACLNVFHSSNTTFRNNTCYQNVGDRNEPDTDEIDVVSSANVQAYNNILVTRSGRDATFQHDSTGLSFDYNLAYGGMLLIVGSNDAIADPLFVNPSLDPRTADFHLQPGSPAIDKALQSQSPADDYAGTPRPQGIGCDIGAYEFR